MLLMSAIEMLHPSPVGISIGPRQDPKTLLFAPQKEMNRLDVGSQKMSQSSPFSLDKSLASDQDAGKKRRVRNIHSFQSDFHSGVSLRGRQHGCIDHAALN